jgi:hypothetical protein
MVSVSQREHAEVAPIGERLVVVEPPSCWCDVFLEFFRAHQPVLEPVGDETLPATRNRICPGLRSRDLFNS